MLHQITVHLKRLIKAKVQPSWNMRVYPKYSGVKLQYSTKKKKRKKAKVQPNSEVIISIGMHSICKTEMNSAVLEEVLEHITSLLCPL